MAILIDAAGMSSQRSASVQLRQLRPDFAFALGQFLRNLDLRDNVEITAVAGRLRQAALAQTKTLAGLRARRNLKPRFAFQRRHLQFGARARPATASISTS